MNVGENISNARKRAGLSQEDLAICMNVSRQCVSLWETNQTVPTLDKIKMLSEVLQVEVQELLEGMKEPSPYSISAAEMERRNEEGARLYQEKQRALGTKRANVSLILSFFSCLFCIIPTIAPILSIIGICLAISSKKLGEKKIFPYALAIHIVFLFAGIFAPIACFSL